MKTRKREKNSQGITLVALVVTIVVLLILAGISINLVLGQNGIVAKSKEAKDKTANASDLEKINLAIGEATLDGLGELSIDKLEDALAKQFGEGKATVEETDGEYIITVGDEQYVISKDGEVSEYKKDETPGTPDEIATDTFQINSIEDLVAVSYSVNKGEDTYLGKTIELGRSLDFKSNLSYANPETKYILETKAEDASVEIGYVEDESGTSIKELLLGETGYIPIGIYESAGFYGVIEGNNYKIKNINITPVTEYGGLIGKVTNDETLNVNNIGIEGGNIHVADHAGGIVGRTCAGASVVIENCYNTATLKGVGHVGGIIGYNEGSNVTVNNSHNSGNITTETAFIGGIVGYNNDGVIFIEKCYNSGEINCKGNRAAGIACSMISTSKPVYVNNCYNTGNITNLSGYLTGGILVAEGEGQTLTVLLNCHNTGNITASGDIGGIIPKTKDTSIQNCYNTGIITNNSGKAGGIVAIIEGNGTIFDCYNTGNLITPDLDGNTMGGIVAKSENNAANSFLNISNCYNTGEIDSYVPSAGIIYENQCERLTITGCYNTGDILNNAHGAGIIYMSSSNEGEIKNCYNTGKVEVWGHASGIMTSGYIAINNCYNSGMIIGGSSANGIGGYGTVTNCYNMGDVENTQSTEYGWKQMAQGIARTSGEIINCYNTGTIKVMGEINGYAIGDKSTVATNCYYLRGSGVESSVGTPKNADEMDKDTFLSELKGSESNTSWTRVDGQNGGMPILSWQVPEQ